MIHGPKSGRPIADMSPRAPVVFNPKGQAFVVCPHDNNNFCTAGAETCAAEGICFKAALQARLRMLATEEIIAPNPGRDYVRLFAVVLIVTALLGLAVKYAPLAADWIMSAGVPESMRIPAK